MSRFVAGDVWGRLGIRRNADEREIKRAYARLLKEKRPEDDALAFQSLRDAYETALELSRMAAAEGPGEEEETGPPEEEGEGAKAAEERRESAAPPGESPLPSLREQVDPPLRQVMAAFETAGPEGALEELDRIFEEDMGLAKREALEALLVTWVAQFDRPPAELIDRLDEEFEWQDGQERVGEQLPRAVLYLLARREGYRQMAKIYHLAERDVGIFSVLGDPPGDDEETAAAAARLRRSRRHRGHLRSIVDEYPQAFRFEIDPRLVDWIAAQLPEPKPPNFYDRLRDWLNDIDIEDPANWPYCRWIYQTLLCLIAPALLVNSQVEGYESFVFYLLAAPFVPLLVELGRHRARRWGEHFDWVPRAALWTLLALSVAAQVFFRSSSYPLWWAAILLAIHLSFENRLRLRGMVAEGAAFVFWYLYVVNLLQAKGESPFGVIFAVPLLSFPGAFFGGKSRPGWWPGPALAAAFAALLLAAGSSLAGTYDSRRILTGLAVVALVLFLRSQDLRLSNIPLAVFAVGVVIHATGLPLVDNPWPLVLYLPLIWLTVFLRGRGLLHWFSR